MANENKQNILEKARERKKEQENNNKFVALMNFENKLQQLASVSLTLETDCILSEPLIVNWH